MGIKEFEFLKSTLAQIEATQKEMGGLKEPLRKRRKKVKSLKTDVLALEEKRDLESASSLQSKIDASAASQQSIKSKLKTLRQKIKSAKAEKDVAENVEGRSTLLMIVIVVIVGAWLFQQFHEDVQNRDYIFVCDNGNEIQTTSLLDGTDDCGDGSDEEDPFWSLSRAQEEEDNTMSVDMGCGLMIFLAIIIPVLLGIGNRGPGEKVTKINSKLKRLKSQKSKLNNDNNVFNREITEGEENLNNWKSIPKGLNSLQRKIASEESKITEIYDRKAELRSELESLSKSVKHLIPYANLLQLSE